MCAVSRGRGSVPGDWRWANWASGSDGEVVEM